MQYSRNSLFGLILLVHVRPSQREHSGSVVENLTRDWGPRVPASMSSLRCGSWARHIYPSFVLIQPRKILTERLLRGCKESKQRIISQSRFFPVMSVWVFLSWTSTKQRIRYTTQGNNKLTPPVVRLEPATLRSPGKHSTDWATAHHWNSLLNATYETLNFIYIS